VSSAEGKTQVFLAATRRKSIDSLMQTLKLAKLNVQSMTIKPLALARLVKDNKAIIVDVQQSEFDVIVLSGGVPQPIRTVPFSSASISWGEKTQLITEEIGRTVDFYNTTSGKTLGNDTILYTTGEFIDPSELRQSISSKFGFSVQSLKSSFIQLSDSRADYYFVNSSLAIQTQVASSQIAELNILPEVFRSKIKWGRVVAIPATVILAVVIAGMVILINDVSANIASVSDQLASSNKILQEKQLERQTIAKEIKTIESNLAKARPSLSEYGDFLIILTERADEINQDMLAVLENLPSNVTLKTFSLGGTSLAVSGDSESETEILSYARALEKTGRFSEVVISTINNSGNGEDGGMAFSLTLLK
ncbi:MAG: PilN domain-containing protein, partial [Dehalococcoidales bacterium]|nr:PilN domain-containing protein [Dehalococcoidales bacterium]